MERLFYGFWTVLLSCLFLFNVQTMHAQTVGIGTDNPLATLHIISTFDMQGTLIERTLTPAVSTTPALEVNDNGNWGAADIYYTGTAGFPASGLYIQNETNSPGQWITNVNNPGNPSPVAIFTQGGLGDGIFINLLGSIGDGVQVFTWDDFNNALYTDHAGFNSSGVFNDNMEDGIGMFNEMNTAAGIGAVNFHLLGPVLTSYVSDISALGGTNWAFESFAWNASSVGFYHDNTNAGAFGGDGWALLGNVNTTTPTAANIVYGGIVAASQYGVGHGILINHSGPSGRNAEFNVINTANSDPALFAVHEGQGDVFVAQNQNNNIAGIIEVADISYTGSDVADHFGVYGYAFPAVNWGIGIDGYGGFRGVTGGSAVGGLNAAGIYSFDDVAAAGLKPFWIDHPLDPENMILKHFALESNDVLNVYQGTVNIGREGKAIVKLPEYFESINVDYSYQLTAIGTPRQPWVAEEIEGNEFTVAGQPNSKVSWMVIANRNDAYVRAYPDRLQNEIMKKDVNRGKYFDPVAHGKPITMRIGYHEPSKADATRINDVIDEDKAARQQEYYTKKLNEIDQADAEGRVAAKQAMSIPSRPAAPERSESQRMQINHEIKTWDELMQH